jgi:hypothetical protein
LGGDGESHSGVAEAEESQKNLLKLLRLFLRLSNWNGSIKDLKDQLMKLFGYLPESLFQPLAGPNKHVYETDLLSQVPLRWMMKKAESQGLSFCSEVDLDGDAVTAPMTDSYRSFGYGIYHIASSPLYRTIGREPDVRDDGSHVNVNETIDGILGLWAALIARTPAIAAFV